jgi:hypothetical protein
MIRNAKDLNAITQMIQKILMERGIYSRYGVRVDLTFYFFYRIKKPSC